MVRVDDRRQDALVDLPEQVRNELANLLGAVLSAEGIGDEAEAGLVLMDTAEMAELNQEHMGQSGPTDVLSFPIDGVGGGADWIVGDVVLCPERAEQQGGGHAGTLDAELRLLVVHGALHLCGWDHADTDQRRRMWARERELMDQFSVLPPLDPWSGG